MQTNEQKNKIMSKIKTAFHEKIERDMKAHDLLNNNKFTIKERVKLLLERHHDLRDDDKTLWWVYYVMYHAEPERANQMSLLKYKEMPSYDTITRLRRMVQKSYPALKGLRKQQRKELEKEIRKTIKN